MTDIEFEGDAHSDFDDPYMDMIAGILDLEDSLAAHGLHVPPQSE